MTHPIRTTRLFLWLAAALLFGGTAFADTLEVTKTPGPGQFATIADALTSASAGDIIEIIDNSAPFAEQVNITLANITIQGQDGLDPRPTIRGVGAANPHDAGLTAAFTYNTADNLIVRNLIIEAGAGDDTAVDARFWNGARFENCRFDGTSAGLNAFRSQVNTTLVDCEALGAPDTIAHFFGGPLVLEGTTVSGGTSTGMFLLGGSAQLAQQSWISSLGGAALLLTDELAAVDAQIDDSVVTSDAAIENNLIVINPGADGGGIGLGVDNCDLLGSFVNAPSDTLSGILNNAPNTSLDVVDTIFHNITSVAFALPVNTGLTGGVEDYCVYVQAPNNLDVQGVRKGYNSREVGGNALLYLDAANDDLRLYEVAPAVGINSTGTPAYAGSRGFVAGNVLEVTHSPGPSQYATVSAAVAAAGPGDVIEIIDNSTPYIEQVAVEKHNILIRGADGLAPKPIIRGNGTVNPFDPGIGRVTFTYNTADNLTLRNLRIECGPDDQVAMDARFWNGARMEDCDFVANQTSTNAYRSQVATTLVRCTFSGANTGVDHFFGGPLILYDCTVRGVPGNSMNHAGGKLRIVKSRVTSLFGVALLTHDFFAEPVDLRIEESFFTNESEFESGNNLLVVQPDGGSAGQYIHIDNCDFVGSFERDPTPTGAAIIWNEVPTSFTVVDTIFYNLAQTYALNGNVAGYLGGFEDFNVYPLSATNNVADEGITPGIHNIGGEALYVNPRKNGNFKLWDNCSAANRSSGGSPDYLGSQGRFGDNHPDLFTRTEANLLDGFHNMYNPHVIPVDDDTTHPWRMYFFGWAVTDCNPGDDGCDAIYLARGSSLTEWQVWQGPDQWDETGDPNTWTPILTADNQFYDEWHNGDPSVVYREGTYYMAYSATGFDSDGIMAGQPGDTDGDISVVMGATSADGVNWTRTSGPILIYQPEVGTLEDYSDGPYTGNFHRPSLMWDINRWRIWFDYWVPGPFGLGMGHAENSGDFTDPADWNVTHALDAPLLSEWPNPDVAKLGNTYYCFADPGGYQGLGGFEGRQIREATSTDGINWDVVEYFVDPDSDARSNQVPEPLITELGGRTYLYVFYANQFGQPLEFRYKTIRSMRRQLPIPVNAALGWHVYD